MYLRLSLHEEVVTSAFLRHCAVQALMESICGLSYIGDIRMAWGEDRHKIQRIVQGSWAALLRTFLPQLKVCSPRVRMGLAGWGTVMK